MDGCHNCRHSKYLYEYMGHRYYACDNPEPKTRIALLMRMDLIENGGASIVFNSSYKCGWHEPESEGKCKH